MSDLIGVEVLGWYDGIGYYLDKKNNKRYSRGGLLIDKDELYRYGKIYKVKQIDKYDFKILSERDGRSKSN